MGLAAASCGSGGWIGNINISGYEGDVMAAIPPWYLEACRGCGIPEEDIQKFLDSPFWNEFFKQVINKNGMHIFAMGQTYGGKTQKIRHLCKWIAPKETIIDIDSGKPGDLQLMLTLGKPVQILIPYGCRIELKGKLPCEVLITPVFDPKQFIREIKKGWVNIISLINFFLEEDNHRRYIRQMFHNYLLDAKLGRHDHFTPCTWKADESQSILGSGRVKSSKEAKETGQNMATIMRMIRSMDERWIIISQSWYDIVGGARENAPCYVVSRGTKVERSEHSVLHYLSGFAESCEPKEGWVVMPNGRYFDRMDSLKFPLYEIPPVKVIYRGFVDEMSDVTAPDELWDRVDLGVFADQAIVPEPLQKIPSRYEIEGVET
jgi:hypothetical protein